MWHDFSTLTSLWSYEAILWWENWGWKGAKENAQRHPARRVMETGSALSSQGPAFKLCVPRSRDAWDQTDGLSWSKGNADSFQASHVLSFIAFSFHYVAHICYFYDHALPVLSHILFHMLAYLRSGTFHNLSRSGSRCDRAVRHCSRTSPKHIDPKVEKWVPRADDSQIYFHSHQFLSPYHPLKSDLIFISLFSSEPQT